jgi:serine/threonine-protein phosphatase 2B catalytic subunit
LALNGVQARGCSYYFNAAAVFDFLSENQLLSMLRAHEYEDEGFMFHFSSDDFRSLDKREDKSMPPLITVFSAPNYCDSYGNTVNTPVVILDVHWPYH